MWMNAALGSGLATNFTGTAGGCALDCAIVTPGATSQALSDDAICTGPANGSATSWANCDVDAGVTASGAAAGAAGRRNPTGAGLGVTMMVTTISLYAFWACSASACETIAKTATSASASSAKMFVRLNFRLPYR